MRWAVLVVVMLGVLVAVATGERVPPSPEVAAKEAARAGIERCWQDYERKSLEPEHKRRIAGACELLEQKYRARYGTAP
jgi:hypothetical protein